ncbi:hypothetical protein DL767_004125 [Monosporascus sp. MG133]|nr:hypothetical protein DL767_004125 [Monosporascus sp. MG133]
MKKRKISVAILGAGVAGIAATQTLTNNPVTTFLILRHNDYLGDRVHPPVHHDAGLGSGGHKNPIWRLVRKHGVMSTCSNYSNIPTHDGGVVADFGHLFDAIDAGRLLTENGQDTSMRADYSTWGGSPGATLERGNHFVTGQRGFATFIEGEAAEFLEPGDCVEARFAVCTFSVGALQSKEAVAFDPLLPRWKREALEQLQIGTYTKIFIQSDEEAFWDPTRILPVPPPTTAATTPPSSRWRPRDSSGRVSVGMALEKHQNLRANVGRLHFACGGTSAQYFGFLQGAWFEGRDAGLRIAAGLLQQREDETGKCERERGDPAANTMTTVGGYGGSTEMEMRHSEPLRGTTRLDEYDCSDR